MRYKCIGNPHCMKTFEYGHALRAHISSCDEAQKHLKLKADVEKLEQEISLEYPGIVGLHRNPHFPTHHHIDQSKKLYFIDKNKFNQTTKSDGFRRQRKAVGSNVTDSIDVKNALTYQ